MKYTTKKKSRNDKKDSLSQYYMYCQGSINVLRDKGKQQYNH